MRLADHGIEELQHFVDTLIVIPNQNLFRIANEKTTFADAFKLADNVLHQGVRGITDLMVMPGLINLDFADIRSVMGEMGKAMMGTGEGEGEKRAVEASEAAIANPLLDNVSMQGAKGVLINITGGSDMTLFEVDEAANRIREEVDPDANIIFGSTFNPELDGKLRVSVVATGIESGEVKKPRVENKPVAQQPTVQKTKPVIPVRNLQPVTLKESIPQTQQSSVKPTARVEESAILGNQVDAQQSAFNKPETQAQSVQTELVNEGVFVAPRPVEPNFVSGKQTSSTVQQSAYNTQSQASQNNQQQQHEDDTPEASSTDKNLGLFGRMAAGVGLSKSQTSGEEKVDAHENISSEASVQDERKEPEFSSVDKEVLDIPAFLRRKQDS